jgi:hypothetical protein
MLSILYQHQHSFVVFFCIKTTKWGEKKIHSPLACVKCISRTKKKEKSFSNTNENKKKNSVKCKDLESRNGVEYFFIFFKHHFIFPAWQCVGGSFLIFLQHIQNDLFERSNAKLDNILALGLRCWNVEKMCVLLHIHDESFLQSCNTWKKLRKAVYF